MQLINAMRANEFFFSRPHKPLDLFCVELSCLVQVLLLHDSVFQEPLALQGYILLYDAKSRNCPYSVSLLCLVIL